MPVKIIKKKPMVTSILEPDGKVSLEIDMGAWNSVAKQQNDAKEKFMKLMQGKNPNSHEDCMKALTQVFGG